MSSDTYVTPPQYARSRGVKPAKVLAWIASGELVGVNMADSPSGRPRWRISPEAIENFERRRSSQPTPKPTRKRRLPAVPKYV